jgi:hypothetical protein
VKRDNILNRSDLAVKDYSIVAQANLKVDKLTDGNSNIIIVNTSLDAFDGDIVYVTDESNKQVYLGIISTIKENHAIQLTCQDFNVYFNLSVSLPETFTGYIEDYVESLITDNYITSDDTPKNVTYFTIQKDTSTSVSFKSTSKFQKINVLWTEFFSAFNLNIKYEVNLNLSEIKIIITTEYGHKNLRTDSSDLLKLLINKSTKNTPNRLDLHPATGNVVQLSIIYYYLLSNNTVTLDKDDPERFEILVNKTIEYEDADNPLVLAQQELQGNIYNHLIEFELKSENQVLRPLVDINLNDRLTLVTPSATYDTVLTGYIIETKTSYVKLIFGKVRKNLTDILRRS